MTAPQTDRPRFYEQQYLDAADLSALVDYQRLARARHDLGAHTWGISAGLSLIEKPTASGVDVFVQPGYAWDGLGRPLLVPAPYRIPASLFATLTFTAGLDDGAPPGRLVDVWLQFTVTTRGDPAEGFASCSTADQSSRIVESFRVVVGDRPGHADRHVPVTVGQYTVDAEQVRRRLGAATDPLLVDESVPHQTFTPNWDRALWLVPLGAVRWVPPTDPTGTGAFAARVAADLDVSMQKRRYAGVVAETLDAARGFVRIRSRDAAAYTPSIWNTDTEQNLLWVEGNARVHGDVKLLDGRVMLRDAANRDIGGPLSVRRRAVAGAMPAVSDLFLQIGNSATATNRLVVGPVTGGAPADFRERFVVTAAGHVGVGAPSPSVAPLTVRAMGAAQELLAFETPAGATTWRVNTLPGGSAGLNFQQGGTDGRLFLQDGGNVGIGTTDPRHRLQIHGTNNALVLVSDAAAGVDRNIGIELRTTAADGVSYIDFTRGSTDVAGAGVPDFSGRLGFNEAGTGAFALRGARLGIETVAPTNRVHIQHNSGLRVNRIYTSGGEGGAGSVWSSISFNAHHNDADTDWVFPDPARRAVTIEMDDTGGVPRFDVFSTTLASSTTWRRRLSVNGDSGTVLLNENGGNTGIGEPAPQCRLHVSGSLSGLDFAVGSHVALIENTSNAGSADVLALRMSSMVPGLSNNFVTFFSAAGSIGSIEGDTAGVSFNARTADYAEWMPRADDEPAMQPGDVVGVHAGQLRRATEGADYLLLISTAPIILANTPPDEERAAYERVAMLGQAPARVHGAVRRGDLLIPSGNDDGTAIAISAATASLEQVASAIGTAWDDARGRGAGSVRCAIGLVTTHAWRSVARAVAAASQHDATPAAARPSRAKKARSADTR